MSELRLRPGLYTIQHVLNREENLYSYASARREPGSPVFGSVERNPEFIQEWRVGLVIGGDGTYFIEAPGEPSLPPLGFSVEPADPLKSGSPVVLECPPRQLVLGYVEKESRGPEEQAFSIRVVPEHIILGAEFYIQQSPTRPAHPPVEVVGIPVILNPPPTPFWIFRPVLLD